MSAQDKEIKQIADLVPEFPDYPLMEYPDPPPGEDVIAGDEPGDMDMGFGGDEIGADLIPGEEGEEKVEPIQMDKELLDLLLGHILEISGDEDAEEQVRELADAVANHARKEEAEGEPTGPVMTGEEDFQEIMDLIRGGEEEPDIIDDEEVDEEPKPNLGGGEEPMGGASEPPFEGKRRFSTLQEDLRR